MADRYAPNREQLIALDRVSSATEGKLEAEMAVEAARTAWLEQMFEASYQGATHTHVAMRAGITAERYRQVRLQFQYEEYAAKRAKEDRRAQRQAKAEARRAEAEAKHAA